MSEGASNFDLDEMAKNKRLGLTGKYIGTFAKDMMPSLMNANDKCCVVNLETSNMSGTHWVSAGCKNGNSWYFDSYGLGIPTMIEGKLKEPITHFQKQIQADHSFLCGEYSLAACVAVSKSRGGPADSLQNFLGYFDEPILDNNDDKLYEWYENLLK